MGWVGSGGSRCGRRFVPPTVEGDGPRASVRLDAVHLKEKKVMDIC